MPFRFRSYRIAVRQYPTNLDTRTLVNRDSEAPTQRGNIKTRNLNNQLRWPSGGALLNNIGDAVERQQVSLVQITRALIIAVQGCRPENRERSADPHAPRKQH